MLFDFLWSWFEGNAKYHPYFVLIVGGGQGGNLAITSRIRSFVKVYSSS